MTDAPHRPRLLLHVCCAPDGLYVAGLLAAEYEVTLWFDNPNIQPREEYDIRVEEARRTAAAEGWPFLEAPYDTERWVRLTRKFRGEPEKGRRCDVCYALRLGRTAETAARLGFDAFTTVMTLSPHKKAAVLNRIGRMFGRRHGVRFVEADFKKKDGFRKSAALSRARGMYRQDYCGCLDSRRTKP